MEISVACAACGGELATKVGQPGKAGGIRLEATGCAGCAAGAAADVRTELERLLAKMTNGHGGGRGMLVAKAGRPSAATEGGARGRCACGVSILLSSTRCKTCAARERAARGANRATKAKAMAAKSPREADAAADGKCACGCGKPVREWQGRGVRPKFAVECDPNRARYDWKRSAGASERSKPASKPASGAARAGGACEICHLVAPATKMQSIKCRKEGHAHDVCPRCRETDAVMLRAGSDSLCVTKCPGK